MSERTTKLVSGVECTEIAEGPFEGVYGPGLVIGLTKPGHCGHNYKIGECPICWPVEPIVTPVSGRSGETVETHPAYAMIGASRVSGSAYLFGSDFEHQHFMTLAISRGEVGRTLSNDWPHAREEYIEVAMSEAQWATMISSPNSQPVPCTLVRRNGVLVPNITRPADRTAQFRGEMAGHLTEASRALRELRDRIEAGSKSKRELLEILGQAERNLSPRNLSFVAEQFGEHMEKTVERAKVEVHAYIHGAVTRAGLAALGGAAPFTMLGTGEPPADTVDAEIERPTDGA